MYNPHSNSSRLLQPRGDSIGGTGAASLVRDSSGCCGLHTLHSENKAVERDHTPIDLQTAKVGHKIESVTHNK